MSVVRKSIFAVALMASGAAYAGTPGWSVSESSGPVFVAKPGLSKTSTVTRGATLSAGDIISTGKGGRAVIVRGGEYLTVAPNTKVQLTEPKAGALTQIVQSFGNVVFKIQKKTTPHFQVNTPYLAAVVKGTTFSVTVTPAGASVQVTEGLVQVQSLDGLASRFVSPGEIGMISAAAPGQLSVLGTPSAPSGGATIVGPAAPVAPDAAPAADAPAEITPTPAATVSEIAEVRIASPIGEGSVNLAAQTGGIVSGNSSLAQASVAEAVATQLPDAPAPAPTEVAVAAAPPAVEQSPAPVVDSTPAPQPAETIVAAAPPVETVPAQPPVLVAVVDNAPTLPEQAPVSAPPVPAETPAQPPVLVAVVDNTPTLPEQAPVSAPPVPAETPAQPPVLVAVADNTPTLPEQAPVSAPPVPAETPAQPPVLVAVADNTPTLPEQAPVNAPPVPAESPAQPPVLVAVADNTPTPAQPEQAPVNTPSVSAAPPVNAVTGAAAPSGGSTSGSGSSGSGSSGSNTSGSSKDNKDQSTMTLTAFLKALQEAAKQSLAKRGN